MRATAKPGEVYSRLMVLAEVPKIVGVAREMLCRCECGVYVYVRSNGLRRKTTRSCGCLRSDRWADLRAGVLPHPLDRSASYIGKRYGRLLIVGVLPKRRYKNGGYTKVFECRCDCGTEKAITHISLVSGHSNSCGCIRKEIMGALNRTHGGSKTKTYGIWSGMLSRGNGSSNPKLYADRGIKVCGRWSLFENFLEDMGECPEGKSLDRIDNDGDYTPKNCRWATLAQQARNKRNNFMVTYQGETLTAVDLADRLGIKPKTFKARIQVLGWSVEDAATTPVKSHA